LKTKRGVSQLEQIVLFITANLFGIGVYCIIAGVVGGWLWPYCIESWATYFDKVVVVQWWKGALMGCVPGMGIACVPVSFITFIAMMFLT